MKIDPSMADKIVDKMMDKILDECANAYNDIPEDKDCKKCPHAFKGQSQGMVTPCFDFCGDFFAGMHGKE